MKKYLVLFSIFSTPYAMADVTLPDFGFNPEKVSLSLSSGILSNGESKEFVVDEGSTVSKLFWKIDNTPIVKADLAWQIFPRLSLNARGWTSVSSSQSLMDDYDWSDPNQREVNTDWSHHPDTALNYANEYDLNINVLLIDQPHFKLGTTAGYQENRFSWIARGGSFEYSDEDENGDYIAGTARSIHGEFESGVANIGYQQKFSMPYLGLTGQYQYNKFELNTALKYSPWVKAKDKDNHYMREITFKTQGKNSDYYGVTANAGYYLLPSTKLFTEVTWNSFKMAKGDTTLIEEGEVTDKANDIGRMANEHYTLSMGVQYRF